MDINDVLARKQPIRGTVPIVLDAGIRERLDAAVDAQDKARRAAESAPNNGGVAADLVAANNELDDAKAAAADVTAVFRFEAMGREPFEQLRDEHPATKPQRDLYKKAALGRGIPPHLAGDLTHNPDTFPPALIASCCVDPTMTVEQAAALWDSDRFSEAELAELFGTALLVNQRSRRHDLGNG